MFTDKTQKDIERNKDHSKSNGVIISMSSESYREILSCAMRWRTFKLPIVILICVEMYRLYQTFSITLWLPY